MFIFRVYVGIDGPGKPLTTGIKKCLNKKKIHIYLYKLITTLPSKLISKGTINCFIRVTIIIQVHRPCTVDDCKSTFAGEYEFEQTYEFNIHIYIYHNIVYYKSICSSYCES